MRISPDVIGDLWRKLMVNCACNAVSALTQQPYGRMAALPAIVNLQRAVVRAVVREVVRRGVELGVPTSVNQALHALVKLIDVNRNAG
ncbi:MAG: ketopantoate reductase family protein [Rubrivivax sp.]